MIGKTFIEACGCVHKVKKVTKTKVYFFGSEHPKSMKREHFESGSFQEWDKKNFDIQFLVDLNKIVLYRKGCYDESNPNFYRNRKR